MREGKEGSVAAGHLGQIDGQPPVAREVVKLNFAKEGGGDGRGSESPRVRVTPEFEAGQKEPDADAGLGAGDRQELREDIRRARSRDCDPDQTGLGFRRLDLALHARDWDCRAGRLPLVLGAEPRDGLLMSLDLGGRGPDRAGVDDLAQLRTGREVEDVLGWIGAGWDLAGI